MGHNWTVYIIAICIVLIAPAAQSAAGARGSEARVCAACNGLIDGSYFETGGALYHPEHFSCVHCDLPISGSYTIYHGSNYHTRCFERHAALRCGVCDGVISGKYILDHWGNAYHTHHENDVLRCDFCQRFVVGTLANDLVRFRDGRCLCGICSPSAVTSLDEAGELMHEVAEELARFGIVVNTDEIELHLMSKEGLRQYSGRGHGTTGFTDYLVKRNLFGRTVNKRIRVNLLYGMPRTETVGTLAHELTHVWQFTNGVLEQNPRFSEGSCNYAAYLVLRKVGGPEAEFVVETMLKDNDPVYGDGFRQVKTYAEANGLAAWLELLEQRDVDLSAR